MAGFAYRGSLTGTKERSLISGAETIITNSVVVSVGDAVLISTGGFISLGTAGSRVYGIVIGVVGSQGEKLDPDASTLDTFTVASDNQTVALKRAIIDISKDSIWFNDADSSLARTDDDLFYDLVSESQINGSVVTNGAFKIIKRDPNGDGDASNGLFVIAESQLDPYAQV